MDVIAAYQGGIEYAVASMGTSFTKQQLQLLGKNVPEIVLAFDGDDPGQHAIEKNLAEIKALSKIRTKVVLIPEKLDPDEFLRKYGPERFLNLMTTQQISAFQFKEIYLKNQYQLTNEQGLSDYLKALLEELVTVSSSVEKDILLHSLAQTYHVSYDVLEQQLQQLTTLAHQQGKSEPTMMVPISQLVTTRREKISQKEKAQQLLLYRIFHDDGVRREIRNLPNFSFVSDRYQELYVLMDTYALEGGEMESGAFLDFLKGQEELTNLATSIFILTPAPETSEMEIQELLSTLQKNSLQETIYAKQRLQKEAHRLGNQEVELSLAVEILNLTKQLKHI